MPNTKKLIEVAMPVKEISAESVRDKSIRHGHISTLHLWWARRPLPVCRAVVFASLVPDPLDPSCPSQFSEAVGHLLSKPKSEPDHYKPYSDIPFTSALDPMEDNLRNRLLMFIGKFSDEFIANQKTGKSTPAGLQLSGKSLIKWESRNNEELLTIARKLIFVAHNAASGQPFGALSASYDTLYARIKSAEKKLYSIQDRHIASESVQAAENELKDAIDAFQDAMPKVFDPFAGGGAIPLEAARLGCKSYGNDINPVAHIIQKGSVEFPQKFGKPISYSYEAFISRYGAEALENLSESDEVSKNGFTNSVRIKNRLAFDVEFYAKQMLKLAEQEIGRFYPADAEGNRPIAYYWARVGKCSNPSCGAEVPLLKQFYLANTSSKQVYLNPIVNGKSITFEIRKGKCDIEGWINRTVLTCPSCSNITPSKVLKDQFITGTTTIRLIAVIEDSPDGKFYRQPSEEEIDVVNGIPPIDNGLYSSKMQIGNNRNFNTPGWGISNFVDIFSPRQLLAMHTFVKALHKVQSELTTDDEGYDKAVLTYLAIFTNRIASRITSFGLWNTAAETLEHPFGRQAIPMVFDYPESNPFCTSTGGATNQIDWICRYIIGETSSFSSFISNTSSGDKLQFSPKSVSAVVTDPPYYDAIAYADLSDFFYVWLKRTVSQLYPIVFSTPQTPKSEECTALKHHHNNDALVAQNHFENKLTQIFTAIESQTSGIVSIMFAHQSTDAWTTLCNSVISAKMNITGSWAISTERSSAGVKTEKSFLASSVTVACRPTIRKGDELFKDVKKEIEKKVAIEVENLYRLGFRGPDLLTACFGQAVSVFGRYNRVEKSDGTLVTVAELLELAKESAFNALLTGFGGDDFTKFYIGWLQLYGFAECDFDDAAKFSRVGLSINVQDLFNASIFIKNGNHQTLAGYADRIPKSKIGESPSSNLIDLVHRGMFLYKNANRSNLLQHIATNAGDPNAVFWRVLTSLCQVLPPGSDDHTQASGLLAQKDSLIRDSDERNRSSVEQTALFD